MSNQQKDDKSLWEEIKYSLSHILDLKEGLDRWGTIESIQNNIYLKGANVWLLISGLFIASIGLDTNSAAVIIGAMLISPLMSPILGIGLGIGINDRKMIIRSTYNFAIAVFISLLVSTIYFLITPLGAATSEIISRTKPTILDVLVAFFGGLAGIVASSRKERLNAVPGVAIATALLPPLCVSGFGIANGNFSIFWGSFYLFFLNSVFVALATLLIVRILRFPMRQFMDDRKKMRNNVLVAAAVIIVCIPSGRMLFNILSELSEKNRIEQYIGKNFDENNHQILKWSINENDSIKDLRLYVVGQYMDSLQIQNLKSNLKNEGLENINLEITQFEREPEDFNKLSEEIKLNVLETVEANNFLLKEKEAQLVQLKNQVDSLSRDSISFKILRNEVLQLYPELSSLNCANVETNDSSSVFVLFPLWKKDVKEKTQKEKVILLEEYFKTKLNIDSIRTGSL